MDFQTSKRPDRYAIYDNPFVKQVSFHHNSEEHLHSVHGRRGEHNHLTLHGTDYRKRTERKAMYTNLGGAWALGVVSAACLSGCKKWEKMVTAWSIKYMYSGEICPISGAATRRQLIKQQKSQWFFQLLNREGERLQIHGYKRMSSAPKAFCGAVRVKRNWFSWWSANTYTTQSHSHVRFCTDAVLQESFSSNYISLRLSYTTFSQVPETWWS